MRSGCVSVGSKAVARAVRVFVFLCKATPQLRHARASNFTQSSKRARSPAWGQQRCSRPACHRRAPSGPCSSSAGRSEIRDQRSNTQRSKINSAHPGRSIVYRRHLSKVGLGRRFCLKRAKDQRSKIRDHQPSFYPCPSLRFFSSPFLSSSTPSFPSLLLS